MIKNYTNPVIKGFHPDPSVCQVKDGYYLVNSSFEYFPGIPIFFSRNLIDWVQVGNCVDEHNWGSFNVPRDSEGIWAPTIRFSDGKFYITGTFGGEGNFLITAKDPRGPWSKPVWINMDGIDPSLYFENGVAYFSANDSEGRQKNQYDEGISLAKIDIQTGKRISGIQRIWQGTGGGWLEAAHIYHFGDYYYLLASEGGTEVKHMEVAARSRDIYGPYENCPFNPVLTNRNDTTKRVQCSGHCELVKGKSNSWWFVHLATRPAFATMANLGRETFLTPVEWRDEWPIAKNDRRAHLTERFETVESNKGCDSKSTNDFFDKFQKDDFLFNDIKPSYIFVRQPQKELYQVENHKLVLRPNDPKDERSTFIGTRQENFEEVFSTKVELVSQKPGDEAGIEVRLNDRNNYRIGIRRDNDDDCVIFRRDLDDIHTIATKNVESNEVELMLKADRKKYYFFYRFPGSKFQQIGESSIKFLSPEVVPKCYVGVVVGLYCVSQEKSEGHANFIYFKKQKTE